MNSKIIILIFGQTMPIETAVTYGFNVINIHTQKSIKDFKLSKEVNDIIVVSDIKEIEYKVEELNRLYSIAGIFSFTDYCNGTYIASKLDRKLGIHSFAAPEAIKIMNNKILTRNLLDMLNMPNPLFIQAYNKEDVRQFFYKTTKPLIIKPTNGEGSKLVSKLTSLHEIDSYFNDLQLTDYKDGGIIVEENINGIEVSVEVLISNNKVYTLGVTDKILQSENKDNPYIEKAHIFPSRLPKSQIEVIIKAATYFLENLDITNCIAHLEFIITDKNIPYLIEGHLRPGGDGITRLIKNSYNLNVYKCLYESVLKKYTYINNMEKAKESCIYFITPRPGIIKEIYIPEISNPLINMINIRMKNCDVIKPIKESGDRIYGELIVTSSDLQSYEIARRIENAILITYK